MPGAREELERAAWQLPAAATCVRVRVREGADPAGVVAQAVVARARRARRSLRRDAVAVAIASSVVGSGRVPTTALPLDVAHRVVAAEDADSEGGVDRRCPRSSPIDISVIAIARERRRATLLSVEPQPCAKCVTIPSQPADRSCSPSTRLGSRSKLNEMSIPCAVRSPAASRSAVADRDVAAADVDPVERRTRRRDALEHDVVGAVDLDPVLAADDGHVADASRRRRGSRSRLGRSRPPRRRASGACRGRAGLGGRRPAGGRSAAASPRPCRAPASSASGAAADERHAAAAELAAVLGVGEAQQRQPRVREQLRERATSRRRTRAPARAAPSMLEQPRRAPSSRRARAGRAGARPSPAGRAAGGGRARRRARARRRSSAPASSSGHQGRARATSARDEERQQRRREPRLEPAPQRVGHRLHPAAEARAPRTSSRRACPRPGRPTAPGRRRAASVRVASVSAGTVESGASTIQRSARLEAVLLDEPAQQRVVREAAAEAGRADHLIRAVELAAATRKRPSRARALERLVPAAARRVRRLAEARASSSARSARGVAWKPARPRFEKSGRGDVERPARRLAPAHRDDLGAPRRARSATRSPRPCPRRRPRRATRSRAARRRGRRGRRRRARRAARGRDGPARAGRGGRRRGRRARSRRRRRGPARSAPAEALVPAAALPQLVDVAEELAPRSAGSGCRRSAAAGQVAAAAPPRAPRARGTRSGSSGRRSPSASAAAGSPLPAGARRRPGRGRGRRRRSRAGSRPPWRSVAYATKPPSPAPTIATRACHARPYLTEPARRPCDEVALEGEEDGERDRQRDERRRRDQLDVGAELAQLREDRDRDRLRLAAEGSATSRSFHVQRNWKIASEAIAGSAERQDQAEEDPDLRGAVDARRLQQVLRDPDEEVAQQEDRERQPERRVEEDQPEHRVEDAERRCRA